MPFFQAVTPSRDVRAQFYSRMGLLATTTAQSSQSIKEEPAPHPSGSSAEDEESSKERAKLGSDKESSTNKTEHENDSRPTITVDFPGTNYKYIFHFLVIIFFFAKPETS